MATLLLPAETTAATSGQGLTILFLFLRATAGTAIARLSHRTCLSVSPSHGWISQKRCKL